VHEQLRLARPTTAVQDSLEATVDQALAVGGLDDEHLFGTTGARSEWSSYRGGGDEARYTE
jgi:hypothetical protein